MRSTGHGDGLRKYTATFTASSIKRKVVPAAIRIMMLFTAGLEFEPKFPGCR
jgi:hypothetical protein